MQKLLQGADKAGGEEQTVDRRRGVVWRIGLASLEIDNLELTGVVGRTDEIKRFVAGLRAVKGVLHSNNSAARILDIENLDAVIVSHEEEREALGMEARHFQNFEVKRVGDVVGVAPGDLCRDEFLGAINHVKLFVILDAHYELVRLVLDTAGYVAVGEVNLSERHQKLKSALLRISLELAEEHAIVTAKADLALARRHDDVEDRVHFKRLRLQHFPHRVHLDDVHMAKVLPKDYVFLLHATLVILEHLDVVDTLLQFLVVLFLESVYVEDKKVAVVTANPGEVVVHTAAEKTVPARLLHNNRAQILVIHMELVAFAARKNKARVIGRPRRDERTSPVDNRLTTLHLSLAAEARRKLCIRKLRNGNLLRTC